ncbi:T-cell ecto-ADP-ribosyltransferase 2-like [Triplophysa dalaica]|uniref:T-cell ecto-ADP-ribosyltransferase 2-like n=1 Tax=Triplophysa dalaica TaxID=1582913 RepID=UPI0024DFB778|nr:T-cell ecto-ADP-ribosyltransferase 2-like [Triplophysa dalaica]
MLTTATLILCLSALGQVFTVPRILELDMAENSVDDQFDGCKEKMAELLVKPLPTASETQEMYPRGFTWNHLFAISAYTGERIYNNFRADTVNGKDNYTKKTYGWYSLYFLLTDAIQILNKLQKEAHPGCIITYRRTRLMFNSTDVVNKNIRFGQFASSSTNRNSTDIFGNVSCFEIRTCEGAHVSKYSLFPGEEEVLIPPYEVFKVTKVTSDWCETVYHLNSAGTKSNLNCALVDVKNLWQSIKDFFKRLVGKG